MKYKTCACRGCEEQISASGRMNTCQRHRHTSICNCARCIKKRVVGRVHAKEPREPYKPPVPAFSSKL